MHKRTRFALPVLLFALVSWGHAQNVDEIIAKHLEAIGGLDHIKAIKSMRMTGKMVMGSMGIEGTVTRTIKRPNNIRMDIGFQGQNMVSAYDGKTAWQIVPFMGDPKPHPMPEDQAKQMIREADFDGPLVDYKEKGHKVEFVGKAEVEGTEALKLKVTLKDGDVFYAFLDPEYYVELKRVTTQKNRQTGMDVEVQTFFSDYKEVAGVMIPHALRIKGTGPGEVNFTVEKVEVNVDLDDALFAMPAEATSEKK